MRRRRGAKKCRSSRRTLTCISRSRGSHLEAPHAGEPEAIDSRRKKGPWEGEEGLAVLFRGTKKYNECRRETNGTLFGRLTSLPCDKGNTFQALPTSGHDRAGIVAPRDVTSRLTGLNRQMGTRVFVWKTTSQYGNFFVK